MNNALVFRDRFGFATTTFAYVGEEGVVEYFIESDGDNEIWVYGPEEGRFREISELSDEELNPVAMSRLILAFWGEEGEVAVETLNEGSIYYEILREYGNG